MLAQIMLRHGLRWQKDGTADVECCIAREEDGFTLRVVTPERVYDYRGLPNRMEVGRRIQDALCEWQGTDLNEWGYLLGMRPTKILHRFLASENYRRAAARFLAEAKVEPHLEELLTDIGELQRPYLPLQRQQAPTAVYIGIPFCPSHCVYCSFPARVARPDEAWRELVDALCEDIRRAADLARQCRLQVDSVYFGGGTPTVLPVAEFRDVLTTIQNEFRLDGSIEFTVEAGRPDTITNEKLDCMIACGVQRISVNPQTWQDHILRRIQRSHLVADIERVMEEVRQRPFQAVNMDFIAGLPEQNEKDMQENMARALAWQPENVTVHTLALKRNSPLAVHAERYHLPAPETTKNMAMGAYENLVEAGYVPYYLYRQKYLATDLPNIGYALPSHECRYNIQMMEERAHILGIGPGATSKAIGNDVFQFEKCYFPWDPEVYRDKCEMYWAKRAEIFINNCSKGASRND